MIAFSVSEPRLNKEISAGAYLNLLRRTLSLAHRGNAVLAVTIPGENEEYCIQGAPVHRLSGYGR
jgi:hypothetical protein